MSRLTLQRLRFYDMAPGLIPPDVTQCLPNFDKKWWEKKGRAVYWREGEGITCQPVGIVFAKGATVSSDTFFNAFFLAYWLRLTRVQTLALTVQTEGDLRLEIYRHTSLGESELLLTRELTASGETSIELDPAMLSSGLRLSFSLTAKREGARLKGGTWSTNDTPAPCRLGIAISTFGRNDFAAGLIRRIFDDAGLQEESIRILVTDQNKASELGHLTDDRCRIVTQKNVGYTGGLTRAITELLDDPMGAPTHILILDDDIDLETDSILRVIRMMQLARTPFIIGGTMLDLYRPNLALCQGENFAVNDEGFRLLRRHLPDTDISDFDGLNSFSIPAIFDYNAGWFCAFPAEIFVKIGFHMPTFIQGYEDAEFCLRAGRNGYPTYTVPSIGVWHLPFYSKAEAGWKLLMAYYHQLVHHSLYGYEDCSAFFFHVATQAMIKLRNGQYRHSAAMVRSLENFLGGWPLFTGTTFPDYLQDIHQYLAAYETASKSTGVLDKTQVTDLKKRLEEVVSRFDKEGENLQADFAARLPSTYKIESWRHYFIHGNLGAVSTP